MSFTNDNDFELQPEGGADWDTPLRSNFSIIERGSHIRLTAGATISSGQICLINSANFAIPYDARSTSLRQPHVISYRGVTSGASAPFVREGIVRSMSIWSGGIIPGAPVFVSPNSLGFAVSSYAGAAFPAGFAVGPDAVWFRPSNQAPEITTEVKTVANILLGVSSYADFDMSLGRRGIVRQLRVQAQSANVWKISFFSGSARVSSEMLYDTLTHSATAGDSVDITSRGYLDQAMFPWYNTDVASPALVFGRISIQNGSSVNTSHFAVTVVLERFS